MANWEEIRETVGRAANQALKKTEELADSASMRVKLKAMESKLEKAYATLGKNTYRQLKTEESRAEEIAKTIEEIDELREKIREQREEIERRKQEQKARKKAEQETREAEKAQPKEEEPKS